MPTQQFSYRRILDVLDRFEVEHIIVGGVCAVAHGAPITTFDLDLVYSQADRNIDRILAALEELDAYHREPAGRRLAPQRHILESGGPALFTTRLGSLDFLGDLSGRGLEDLLPNTVELTLGSGLKIRILDLKTLIEVKELSGRPKDLVMLPILRQTLNELHRKGDG